MKNEVHLKVSIKQVNRLCLHLMNELMKKRDKPSAKSVLKLSIASVNCDKTGNKY